MTARDILLAVILPLILAEVGPWCGWLAARLLPWAARLRYGGTERAAVRLEEWSADLDGIPGQLTKLAYAIGQLAAGSAVSAKRKCASPGRKIEGKTLSTSIDLLLHMQSRLTEDDGLTAEPRAVLNAVQSLPDQQRQAIVLRYASRLADADVAAVMGISPGAVIRHLETGMATLCSALEPEYEAEHEKEA